jgi:hypothetical protein
MSVRKLGRILRSETIINAGSGSTFSAATLALVRYEKFANPSPTGRSVAHCPQAARIERGGTRPYSCGTACTSA